MKKSLLILILISCMETNAQYYYNDYLTVTEITHWMQTYTDNKVSKIVSTGYDANGIKTTDFQEWQEVLENGLTLRITAKEGIDTESSYYRFNTNGQLISISDSSYGIISNTFYTYNEAALLSKTEKIIKDNQLQYHTKEVYEWLYDANSHLVKMIRMYENDTATILFRLDEQGNIADEIHTKQNRRYDSIYYYYDDDNRLLDVVRFNTKAQKLLPDFMFEYDEQNNVIQKITVVPNNSIAYLTWRYIYNPQGLKTKEVVFDRYKQQTGRIDYHYTFIE